MFTFYPVIGMIFFAIFAMAAQVSFDTHTWRPLCAEARRLGHRQIVQADSFLSTRVRTTWPYSRWVSYMPMGLIFRVVSVFWGWGWHKLYEDEMAVVYAKK